MTFNIPQKKTHVRKLGLDKKLLNCLINILLFTRKGAYGTSAFLCLLWLVGSYDWGFELIAVALQSWRLWSDYSLIHSFYSLTLLFFFNFIFKLYIIVLVLPNIKMNPPQVYMCSPSWTLLPAPSPFHPSGSSQCTSPKHPVSCIEPGLATRFIHDSVIFIFMQCKLTKCYWLNVNIFSFILYVF